MGDSLNRGTKRSSPSETRNPTMTMKDRTRESFAMREALECTVMTRRATRNLAKAIVLMEEAKLELEWWIAAEVDLVTYRDEIMAAAAAFHPSLEID
jgi:hypothetical protein